MTALRLLPLALLLAACVATPPPEDAPGGAAQPGDAAAPAATRLAAGPMRPAATSPAIAIERRDLAQAAARLPASAADFARGTVADHERRFPGRGVSVDFATANRTAAAEVALYDLGRSAVPADPDSGPQRAEFEAVVRELTSLPPERTGRRFTERGRFRLPVPGGPDFACADFDGMLGRNPVRQTVCVGGAGGRFMKVQVTMLAADPLPADARAFAAAVGQAARGR